MSYAGINLRKLKLRVSIQEIIAFYQIELRAEGDNLWGDCPLCCGKHDSQKNRKLRVTLIKNKWKCFGCHAEGNTLDLVAALEAVDVATAARFVVKEFNITDCYVDKQTSSSRNAHGTMKKPHQVPLSEKSIPEAAEVSVQPLQH